MKSGTVLDRIGSSVLRRLNERKTILSEKDLRALCETARNPFAFEHCFSSPGCHIIAEIKFSSPSQGSIVQFESLSPETVAREYLQNGAAALSILTEQDHFHGNLEYLKRVRHAFPQARLLMKDFILDEYQLLEARAFGADAALLIVALLGEAQTQRLLQCCRELGLTALVEVHDEEEFQIASNIGATLIGVNNRNLKNLEITLETSHRLAALAPRGACLISESGLNVGSQLKELSEKGYSGFLIGTSFMKTRTPGIALARLLEEAK